MIGRAGQRREREGKGRVPRLRTIVERASEDSAAPTSDHGMEVGNFKGRKKEAVHRRKTKKKTHTHKTCHKRGRQKWGVSARGGVDLSVP